MRALIGALNGVLGDYLDHRDNPLAIGMDFYVDGQALGEGLGTHLETVAGSGVSAVNIFLHGSSDTEACWQRNKARPDYGRRLLEDFGQLPLYLRYNSGLHISENGRKFSRLMERSAGHPAMERIHIIGFSMGGLVFRSACQYALDNGHQWIHKVGKVFYIGTPHLGAPLEKFGAWTESILRAIDLPYTALASKIIGLRSAGIKDMRHGYLQEAEWAADAQNTFPVNRRLPAVHLDSAEHYIAAGTWHSDARSLTADWLGDLMVRKTSAMADCPQRGRTFPIPEDHVYIAGGHHHLHLLASDEIYGFLKTAMEASPEKIAL